MHFKKLYLNDVKEIEPYYQLLNSKSSDLCLATILMWRDYFNLMYCIENDTLYQKVNYDDQDYYLLPLSKDIEASIDYLIKEKGNVQFSGIDDLNLKYFKNYQIETKYLRQCFDYVYLKDDLINLSGKKYSAKRNLIKQFIRNHPNYSYSIYHKNDQADLINYLDQYFPISTDKIAMANEEIAKVKDVLQHYDDYRMFGLILRDQAEIIGFSFGSILGDMLFVHIEKAKRHDIGSYQILSNLFVQEFGHHNIKYVNKEDDMGIEGLRKAKLDYHPIELVKKHTITIKNHLNR